MSNTDFDPNFVPDPANVIQLAQRQAVGQVATSVDDNPDDAAQALKISGVTGAPASVVYGDLDHHEAQLKARLSSQIVAANPLLQSYVNSHPMAAKVSNDDYGQLDAVSEALRKVAPGQGYEGSILQAAVKGFQDNFNAPGLESEFEDQAHQMGANPLLSAVLMQTGVVSGVDLYNITSRLFSGIAGGGGAGLSQLYKNLGGNEAWGDRLTRDLIVAAQVGLAEPIATPEGLLHPEARKMINDAAQFSKAIEPYARAGVVPPVGVHPLIDEVHVEQAKMDAKSLSDALKESVKSSTRDRAPDMFANYVRGISDGDIGVAPDAVRALYGDKPPTSGDGLLGDLIPGLEEKLTAAEATGSDLKVPLADWLAKVEPDVAKALQDHIRVRPEGLTVEEAKNLQPVEEAKPTVGEGEAQVEKAPVDVVRQVAGLEPRLEPLDGQPTTKAQQLELPAEGTTRIEDREAFAKASAIGMTVDQYNRYQRLIEKRAAEDAEAVKSRAMEQQRKTQGAEWKANRAELRPKVKDDLLSRPEFELDEMLREGKVKLARDALTPDQIATLPASFVAKDGIHPDDLASLFGDSDGGAVVGKLVSLHQARGDLRPGEFFRQMVEAETDRQMELRYGPLDKNILEEAKDQVLSETQEQLLHEETLARATEAGLEYSIGKEELKGAIKDFFDRGLVKDVSSDVALADAGRAGRAAEMALLKGDAAEAFRQKQRQYNAVVMANFARKFEKDRARFEKLADRYDARQLKAVDQEYTNWIRDLLARTGKLDPRKIPDLAGLIDRSDSGIKALGEFVDYKEHHDLRELPVADFLRDPNFRKEYGSMAVADARDLHDAVRALNKNGRDEMKYIRQGEEHDLAELKRNLIESLQRFKEKEYTTEGDRAQVAAGVRHVIRTAIVSHLQVETVFNRLDRYDPKGPWNQFVFRPLAEAANHEAKLEREFARKLGGIADNVNLKERIPDSPFRSPFTGEPMVMTRKNLRAALLNLGNESNFNKLARGYLKPDGEAPPAEQLGQFKADLMNWVNTHATKEDWDWSQKVWDMLKELGERSDTMYRGLTGVAPEKLQIKPIQTPHGTYDGGYYPLIRHELYGEDVKLSKNDLEGAGYIRATTAAGYTKKRTGAIYPLSLDLDALPNQIRQIIHDTSYRPAVIQAGKIFYDNKIKTEFKKHLGTEYADMFVPWLKDVANTQNYFASRASKEFQQFSDFMRQNAITTLVGLNPSTFLKHTPTTIASSIAEVGPKAFAKAASSLLTVNDETGNSNWRFAMEHSEELQRRSRNWVETMGGGMRQLEGRTVGKALAQHEFGAAAMNLRDVITELSSKPVAMGDLVSAVPTWMAKYTMEMEDHGVHGDAVYAADKSVRQAHGSSAITSRSAVARSRALSWFTGFFTFFNDLLNRQVETLWRAGEALDLAKEGRHTEAMAQVPKIAGRLFAYVAVPAMIEEMVSPLSGDQKEGWGAKAAKGLAFTLSSSWVGVRDVVSAILNGRDPSAGLLTTSYKSITDMVRDIKAPKPKPGNIVKHGTTLAGMLTGMAPAQIGRTAEWAMSKEKPKGPWGWLVGARYGTLKNHAPTFQRYMEGR